MTDSLQVGVKYTLGFNVGVTHQVTRLGHFATAFALFVALTCAFIFHSFAHTNILLKVAGRTWAIKLPANWVNTRPG